MKTTNQPQEGKQEAKQEVIQSVETSAVANVLKQSLQTTSPKKPGTMSGLKSNDIRRILDDYKLQIAQALPKHLTPERMIQIATTVISQNPAIKECTTSSIIGAVMQSSILGFDPSPILGQCYFVPFNKNIGTKEDKIWVKECQFVIGYKGYIDLTRRSGLLKNIDANVVRKGDIFEYEYGLEPKLKHIPATSRGEITYVYAVAHYINGGYNFVVLSNQEIEMLRRLSPMQKETPSGAWAMNEVSRENMYKAKAVKQLAKYMPLSLETVINLQSDEQIIEPDMFTKQTNEKGEEITVIRAENLLTEIQESYTASNGNGNNKEDE